MTPSCWKVYQKTHKMKGDPSKWVSSKSQMVAVSYNSMRLSFLPLCHINKTIKFFIELVISLVCWWIVKVIGNTLKLVFIIVLMCIDACCYTITLPSCAIIVFCYLIMYIVVCCLLLCYSF